LDTYEAAQLLGVAAYEVTSVEQDSEGNWVAVHEDYASHVTTRRLLPVQGLATGGIVDSSALAAVGESGPEAQEPQSEKAADTMADASRKPRPPRKPGSDADGA